MLTEEQLRFRWTGISASEISAICGLNPWHGPGDVWSDKLGLTEPWAGNEDTERGNELEHALVSWTGRRLGVSVRPNNETFRSKSDDLALATPDGFTFDDSGKLLATVEVKAPSWRTAKDWIDPAEVGDGVPKYYLCQAHWQAGVLGLDTAIVSGLIDGRLWTYKLAFSAPLFHALLERAHEFWRFVEQKEPPPFESGQDPSWIGRVYRTQADEDLVEVPGEKIPPLIHCAQTYLEAMKLKSKAEVDMREAKGFLCSMIEDHAGIKLPGLRCTWKQDRASIVTDWEAIATEALGLLAGVMPVEEIDAVIAKFKAEKPGVRRFLLKEESQNGSKRGSK
jgi:putative phage-type endonuclease